MIGFFRRLFKDRRGNVLAIACAAMPMVIGCAGLATDTIEWTLWKRQLQRAADSAAIAGVYERVATNGGTSTVSATVTHDLTLNQHTWMGLKSGYPQVTFPANSGVSINQVQVTLAIQQSLPFSSLFMSAAPIIVANATAASVPSAGDACVQALEINGSSWGIKNNGNAGIYMPDCVMYSNSPATNTALAGGSSSVTAQAVAGVGGIQASNNWNVQAYRPYSPALADPFAGVTPNPSDMKCAGHWVTSGGKGSGTVTTWVNDALTSSTNMSAAVDANGNAANCWTSMSVGSNTTLTVPSGFGPVYINGGDANVQGNLSCTGCALVLTNSSTATNATIGKFSANAGSNINLTAPTTGTFAGIAIYQDRRATDSSPSNKVNGNDASIITGALYFPSQQLDYNGTGTTAAQCTMFVARRVQFTGNNTTTNKFKSMSDCAYAGLPGGGATRMVRLVA
ncbi:MAG: pilus assembly protein TadG-related protein [Sphingomicrobium sp.]